MTARRIRVTPAARKANARWQESKPATRERLAEESGQWLDESHPAMVAGRAEYQLRLDAIAAYEQLAEESLTHERRAP